MENVEKCLSFHTVSLFSVICLRQGLHLQVACKSNTQVNVGIQQFIGELARWYKAEQVLTCQSRSECVGDNCFTS